MCKMSEEKKKAWIAISGTMASGKSSVLAYLKEKGYAVYDCDAINASLQRKGEEGYERMVEAFGHEILNKDMELDRKKVASLVFSNEHERKKLEGIMHPLILRRLKQIRETLNETAFVEVPLLYELGWEKYFDCDWLIVADEKKLIERCQRYRQMDEKATLARIRAQMSVEDKKKRARVIIENNEDLKSLYQKVDDLLERSSHE